MDEKDRKQAESAYKTVCAALEEMGLKFDKHDEKLAISCEGVGEDLPIEIRITVLPEQHIVSLISQMPFKVPEARRPDIALVTSIANYKMVDGNFDFNTKLGNIFYRQTTSYWGSLISKEVIKYLMSLSITMIDEFNDKFMAVSTGAMSVDDFAAKY